MILGLVAGALASIAVGIPLAKGISGESWGMCTAITLTFAAATVTMISWLSLAVGG